MATPDPEGFSMLTKVAAGAAAVITPLAGMAAGAYKWIDHRFDKKADKEMVKDGFDALNNEMTIQRGNIGKLFDKIGDESQINEQRHRELMMHLLDKAK